MKLAKKARIKKSKKSHVPDHERNDEFYAENTQQKKVQERKLTRGKFFGKKWFPFGNR